MTFITNNKGFGLSMAVWLAHDTYSNGQDLYPDKAVISATKLLKGTRKIILESRVPPSDATTDVADRIAARLGHAVHDHIETTWREGYAAAMESLGYPQKTIEKIRINPTDEELSQNPSIKPVYLEQRFFRPIVVDGEEFIISGQVDQIILGELNDTKTTSVYSHIKGSKKEDYVNQGSLYRWLAPDKITEDIIRIQHVFTDWQRSQVGVQQGYPEDRVHEAVYSLKSLEETEAFVVAKIREILANMDLPENQIVPCSEADLWLTEPQFKYYANPAKAAEKGRSTKNFDNRAAAQHYMATKGKGKGVIIETPRQAKACGYCPGAALCSQKEHYA